MLSDPPVILVQATILSDLLQGRTNMVAIQRTYFKGTAEYFPTMAIRSITVILKMFQILISFYFLIVTITHWKSDLPNINDGSDFTTVNNYNQSQQLGDLMNFQQRLVSTDKESPQSQIKKQRICIKFNRKQENVKGDRKKLEPNVEATERICFISPQKTNGYSPRHPAIAPINHPNVLKTKENFAILKEQSYILANESPQNMDQRMNDSILSLMDELKGENDRRQQDEIQEYLHEILNLREQIDALQAQNRALKGKSKDFELLQEFLIERETYISEVTDKNIFLSEQLHLIQKQNARISQQFSQLKSDFTNDHQMYEDYIRILKNQRQTEKSEFDMMLRLNVELNQRLQEANMKKGDRVKRHSSRNVKDADQLDSPTKKGRSHRTKTALFTNQPSKQNCYNQNPIKAELKIGDECETVPSKETDLSQLNMRSMDEYSILQRLNDQTEPCDCRDVIKKLRQKISYNEIQIDILKRIKVNSEKVKTDNEKLKSQNKKLLLKIQQMCNKTNKVDRKRNNKSDSSLELSLSPKKHQK